MLSHKTVRCCFDRNNILSTIDSAVGKFGDTRQQAMEALMASAMEEAVTGWFEDDDVLAVQLPAQYVRLCVKQGHSYERIVQECLERGLRWLTSIPE